MTDKTVVQQANALITKYVKLYEQTHGSKPLVNRYRDKWGFKSMIEDLGRDDAAKVIDYYFSLTKLHDLIDLFRSYDELHRNRLADEEDARRVAQLQIETAKRVKEYLEKWPQKN